MHLASAGQGPKGGGVILALDPSSTCVGYAVLAGLSPAELIDAGRLRPSMAVDAIPDLPDWLREHLRQPALKAAWRVAGLVRDAVDLVREHRPRQVVIEIPSGLFGSGARNGARGSLTTYGMAAGAIWAAVDQQLPGCVAPVTERQWTPDRGAKGKAQLAIAGLYKGYSLQDDPGADVADAIGLARWWISSGKSGL